MEARSGHRLIRLKSMLVEQARMGKVLRGVIEQVESVLTASSIASAATW